MVCTSITVHRRRIAVRVFRLCQLMKFPCKIERVFLRIIDLVVQSPHVNGRMVEVLADQFPELRMRIFTFLPRHTIHKRNLGPNNQTEAVTSGIEILGLLVMCQTYRGGTDIHYHGQVRVMLFFLQCASKSPPVLMAGHTVHRIFLSVQIKAVTRHNVEMTQAQRLRHLVITFPSLFRRAVTLYR